MSMIDNTMQIMQAAVEHSAPDYLYNKNVLKSLCDAGMICVKDTFQSDVLVTRYIATEKGRVWFCRGCK